MFELTLIVSCNTFIILKQNGIAFRRRLTMDRLKIYLVPPNKLIHLYQVFIFDWLTFCIYFASFEHTAMQA